MAEAVKIAVVLEGGCVSAVLSAGVPVEFVVIDYDTDGADPGELVAVPQDQPAARATAPAYVSEPCLAEIGGSFVLAAHERFAVANGEG